MIDDDFPDWGGEPSAILLPTRELYSVELLITINCLSIRKTQILPEDRSDCVQGAALFPEICALRAR